MEKNYIFWGAVGAAVLLAVIVGIFSSDLDDLDNGHRIEISHHDKSRRAMSVEFNGKQYQCDAETGSVVLEHDNGNTTTVICD